MCLSAAESTDLVGVDADGVDVVGVRGGVGALAPRLPEHLRHRHPRQPQRLLPLLRPPRPRGQAAAGAQPPAPEMSIFCSIIYFRTSTLPKLLVVSNSPGVEQPADQASSAASISPHPAFPPTEVVPRMGLDMLQQVGLGLLDDAPCL